MSRPLPTLNLNFLGGEGNHLPPEIIKVIEEAIFDSLDNHGLCYVKSEYPLQGSNFEDRSMYIRVSETAVRGDHQIYFNNWLRNQIITMANRFGHELMREIADKDGPEYDVKRWALLFYDFCWVNFVRAPGDPFYRYSVDDRNAYEIIIRPNVLLLPKTDSRITPPRYYDTPRS